MSKDTYKMTREGKKNLEQEKEIAIGRIKQIDVMLSNYELIEDETDNDKRYILVFGRYEKCFNRYGIKCKVITTSETTKHIVLEITKRELSLLEEHQGKYSDTTNIPNDEILNWGLISEEIDEDFTTSMILVDGVEMFVDDNNVCETYLEMVIDECDASDLIECESILDFVERYAGCSYQYNIAYMIACLIKMNGGDVEAFFNKYKLA